MRQSLKMLFAARVGLTGPRSSGPRRAALSMLSRCWRSNPLRSRWGSRMVKVLYTWPEDAIKMLREHWDVGLSATRSAKIINETLGTSLSRNSILGKRHRLGLPRRGTSHFDNNPKPVRIEVATGPEAKMRNLEPDERLSTHTFDAVMSLRSNSCRFPIGEVGAPDFRFCCEPRDVGSSYCAEHRAVCGVMTPARRAG